MSRDMRAILEDAGFEVLAVLTSAEEVGGAARTLEPDLVLLDIGLSGSKDGVELAAELDAPVLFVSGRADDGTLARARGVEAAGFVVKPFSPRQLVAAVQLALSNRPTERGHDAERALTTVLEALQSAGVLPAASGLDVSRVRSVPGLDALSTREREVLEELLAYRRPPQIAEQLHISPHTVRNHLKSIYAKLGVHSQAELLDLLLDRD